MSDAEFDALIEQLPPEHALRNYLGERGSSSHQHSPKMLSLDKARLELEIQQWRQSIEEDPQVLCTPKLDGVACRLVYVQGKFVGAYTRGDGLVGEDITRVAIRLLSVPENCSYAKVDGELVLDKETFAALKSTTNYSLARSAVVGLISRTDSGAAAEAGVRFIAYTAHATKSQNAPDSLFARLQQLNKEGFSVVTVYHQCPVSELLWPALVHVRRMAQETFVDTDGVVIRIDSMATFRKCGETEHHPRGAIALKHPNDAVVSTVTGVTFQVGRTGALTPVLQIAPVMVEGAEVERATLHNIKQFRAFAPSVGARVEIKRAGSVIPFVVSISPGDGEPIKEPEQCPSCGGPLMLEDTTTTAFCANAHECPESCKEAAVASMLHFAEKVGIEGIGPVVAQALYDAGATRGPDIYLAARRGTFERLLGDKTAQNICAEIYAKQELPLSVVLEACGIDRIGKTHAQTIAAGCPHTDPQSVLAYFDSLAWADSFGAVESVRMRVGWSKRRDIFARCLKRIKLKERTTTGGQLAGKAFCFTGELPIPRPQAEGYVEELGGICQSGVSRKTDFLVCAAEEANSTKYKKALELQSKGHHIVILSGTEFLEKIKAARS